MHNESKEKRSNSLPTCGRIQPAPHHLFTPQPAVTITKTFVEPPITEVGLDIVFTPTPLFSPSSGGDQVHPRRNNASIVQPRKQKSTV